MSAIEVELYALSDMNTALRKLKTSANEAIEQARQAIKAEKTRLAPIEKQRREMVSQCQRAYDDCIAYRSSYLLTVDDPWEPTGFNSLRPTTVLIDPCESYLEALQASRRALEEVREQRRRLAAQAEQYQHQAAQFRQVLEETIPKARENLEKHIDASLVYLRNNSDQLGTVEGAGTHGTRYQRARREWFRRGAEGELRRESGEHQGWMRQEVNRNSGYYRSVPYYDVGHIVAGIDIPENFRWELRHDNRRRPRIAQRHNLPPTYN